MFVYDGNVVTEEQNEDNEETARNVYGRNIITREYCMKMKNRASARFFYLKIPRIQILCLFRSRFLLQKFCGFLCQW